MPQYPISDAPSDEEAAAHLPKSARRYDLDWLRIIAIITLLFYHTGMLYVLSWDWHIKSTAQSAPMKEVMRWLHQWRMPLLFFISGAGTFFALKRRTYGSYAGERVRRLFVPLLFGMFAIVPSQIYYEWVFKGWFTGSYIDFYPKVLEFQPYRDGIKSGAFSWHHLWFILYLFNYALISIPLYRWLKSSSGQRFTDRVMRQTGRRGGALWFAAILVVSQLLLKPFFPEETHGLYNDWAYFVKNLLLFWAGYLLTSRPDFAELFARQRRLFLYAMLGCTALFYGLVFIWDDGPISEDILEPIYTVTVNCLTWFSVLATIGYGYRYLNVNRPMLPQLNEAVYPFYILHQTVIIVIGYYVLTRTGLGVYDGFLVVSLSSGLVCVAIYLLLIRPFRLTRFLFGLK
jgi:hypothetical protein